MIGCTIDKSFGILNYLNTVGPKKFKKKKVCLMSPACIRFSLPVSAAKILNLHVILYFIVFFYKIDENILGNGLRPSSPLELAYLERYY